MIRVMLLWSYSRESLQLTTSTPRSSLIADFLHQPRLVPAMVRKIFWVDRAEFNEPNRNVSKKWDHCWKYQPSSSDATGTDGYQHPNLVWYQRKRVARESFQLGMISSFMMQERLRIRRMTNRPTIHHYYKNNNQNWARWLAKGWAKT